MKTTIDLPDELVREVKFRAVMQRRTVKDLVAEFLRRGMDISLSVQAEPLPAHSMVQIDSGGLPVIKCRPNASATKMSTKKLLDLEQNALAEEDMKRAGISV